MGMLVLSRRKNQKVYISDDKGLLIEVVVAKVNGGKVTLGFTAPAGITIDRKEVFESKQKGSA